jgi:thiamine-phosphate pyrophosphorylase
MASTRFVKIISGSPGGRLNFITMDDAPFGHREQVEQACLAGIRWIQLRMKRAADKEFLETALAAREICNTFGATLIVNDRIDIALRAGADGVHLGNEDEAIDEARGRLGQESIIGGTANSIQDIHDHCRKGADYIGLGPFRYTTTKKKLSPVLGLPGFREIMTQLKAEGIDVPIVAIGGIRADDLPDLLKTGIYGIAFSGLLVQALDKNALVRQLEAELESNLEKSAYVANSR